MKFFKFITKPLGGAARENVLAALSDEEVQRAIQKMVKIHIIELTEPMLKALKEEVEK